MSARASVRHWTVANVMTRHVHVSIPSTPFKTLVRLIEENRVSAIPIVDDHGYPIGVVSETDLLLKELRWELESTSDLLHMKRRHRERSKAQALVASDVMTAPALTVRSDDQLAHAARLMQQHNVRRLIVVDEGGKMAGIVSRSDLLEVFLRADQELLGEIVDQLLPALLSSTESVGVGVQDNVVTLDGVVARKTDADNLIRRTSELDGVVGVVNRLSYRWDDTLVAAPRPF